VHALSNIEAKKKYEFLESISAVMDAHLRYFKQAWSLYNSIDYYCLVYWVLDFVLYDLGI
jgi:Arf-GAP/coiled-coil/ANK repeat/PH domain-containing protein